MRAVQEKRRDARIRVVVSNRPTAAGLDLAHGAAIPPAALDHHAHSDRTSFESRLVALLPAFKGLHAQRQALQYGARNAGVTVHFVDEEMDHGPIIAQAAVSVHDEDTEETLSERILAEEHRHYPLALQRLAQGELRVAGRRVIGGLP